MAIIISTTPDPLALCAGNWRTITFTEGERPPIIAEFRDFNIFYLEIDWHTEDVPKLTGYLGHIHAISREISIVRPIKARRWSITPDGITVAIGFDWSSPLRP